MSGANGPRIHQTALIDASAQLHETVTVGPYSIVGPGVQLGAGTKVDAHCVIEGPADIGQNNSFHPFSRIGGAPQDKKYAGEPTSLTIGDNNMFREYVTINRGTAQDRGNTLVGNDNWIMAYVHIAHDCVLGSNLILANTTNLAGHVHIDDWAILGGYTGVHQFCKVGAHAMTGVGSVVLHDIPPYVMASGDTASAHGINSEGLKRRGFDKTRIKALRQSYKLLYKSSLGLTEAKEQIKTLQRDLQDNPGKTEQLAAADVTILADFLNQVSRGIVR